MWTLTGEFFFARQLFNLPLHATVFDVFSCILTNAVSYFFFSSIFDKGLNLPKPETVPFRLTANMLDAFGPTGADGVYTSSLKLCMGTLRDNRDTLLSVLEPFIKDPVIDWKRTRSSQSPKKSSGNEMSQQAGDTRKFSEAKHSVRVLDERLQGIYNLRNPNHKRIRRTDSRSVDQNVQLARLLPLSVEGQVHKMISEATSSENLVQLYVGWMPWV
jgi:serine/threonine-protein kinase ATR